MRSRLCASCKPEHESHWNLSSPPRSSLAEKSDRHCWMEEFGFTSTEISRKDSDRDVTFSHHKHLVSLTVSPWKTSWTHVCFSFSLLLLDAFLRMFNASLMPPMFVLLPAFDKVSAADALAASFPEPFLLAALLLSSPTFLKSTSLPSLPSSTLRRPLPLEILGVTLPALLPLLLEFLFES